MMKIKFNYQQQITIVEVNLNDTFEIAVKKFLIKTNLSINGLSFISSGRVIQLNEFIKNITTKIEKREGLKNVLVDSNSNNSNNIIESKDIICPECKEPCKMEINNYLIKLYDCKNGHCKQDIKVTEFFGTQKIDLSKIICDECKIKNRAETYQKEFFFCLKCDKNLCVICKSKHDQTHFVVNYDLKSFLCKKHKEIFNGSYCNDCRIDLCSLCTNEQLHKIQPKAQEQEQQSNFNFVNQMNYQTYQNINNPQMDMMISPPSINQMNPNLNFPNNQQYMGMCLPGMMGSQMNLVHCVVSPQLSDFEKISENLTKLRKSIDNFEENVNKVFLKYNEIMKEIEMFYKINSKILNNYKNNNSKNYYSLYNIETINNFINNEIKKFNDKYIPQLLYLCNDIKNENTEIELKYIPLPKNSIKINEVEENNERLNSSQEQKKNRIRIFGSKFVENNKYKCKIIYNKMKASAPYLKDVFKEQEYYLHEFFDEINSEYDNESEIIFKLRGINNITNLSGMFAGCNSLASLPDISKWNISNVTNMSAMFDGCYSLASLPDISKWNTSNATDMSAMFANCNSLKSLPDISKWNTSNVILMNIMFQDCRSLISLPDISGWNTAKVKNMTQMFLNCTSLKTLPALSKWDISNVVYKSQMFRGCPLDLSIPYQLKY